MSKISPAEVETLIRKKIKEKGLVNDISIAKMEEINKAVREKLSNKVKSYSSTSPLENNDVKSYSSTTPIENNSDNQKNQNNLQNEISNPEIIDPSIEPTYESEGHEDKNKYKHDISEAKPELPNAQTNSNAVATQGPPPNINTPNYAQPTPITQTTTVSKEAIDTAKKEGEITTREQELVKKETELANREQAIAQKEADLAYKPQMPIPLSTIGNEELFVFDENEIENKGAEALSKAPLHFKNATDEITSMEDIWLEKAGQRADIYKTTFTRIGELVFNPFDGTTRFIKSYPDMTNTTGIPNNPSFGMTVQDAMNSQDVDLQEPITDSIEPVLNTIQPLSSDSDTELEKNKEIDNLIKGRVESFLKDYFETHYPKL